MNANSFTILSSAFIALLLTPLLKAQGQLDPPPGAPAPTMRTLNEVFNAVNGTKPLPPSSIIELSTSAPVTAGSNLKMVRIAKTGSSTGSYTVPAGKVLVITDIGIFPESYSATSIITVALKQGTTTRRTMRIRGDKPQNISLRSGMVFASGAELSTWNNSPGGSPGIRIFMQGYLVEDN